MKLKKYIIRYTISPDYIPAAIFFCASFYFFKMFIGFRDTEKNYNKKVVAKIIYYKNSVSLKQSNSAIFKDVVQKEDLGINDTMFVSNESLASIVFLKTKNKVTISKKTLIRIEDNYDNDKIELIDGRIELQLNNKNTIEVKTNNEVINLRSPTKEGSTLDLSSEGGQIKLKALSGRSVVNRSGVISALQVRPSHLVDETRLIKAVPVSFIFPIKNQSITIPVGEDLKIKWSTTIEGQSTLIINANGAQVLNTPVSSDSYELKDPNDGRYDLIITSGESRDKVTFNLKHKADIRFPKPTEETHRLEDGPLSFKWSDIRNEDYSVSILDESDLEITKVASKSNAFSFYPLDSGTFRAKVSLSRFPYISSYSKYVTVTKKVATWKEPDEKSIVSSSDNFEISNTFTGSPGNGLIVTSGKEVLGNSKITGDVATVAVSKSGKYCFKIVASNNKHTRDSDYKCTNILFRPPFEEVIPSYNIILKRKSTVDGEDYTFELPIIKNAVKYEVSIYKSLVIAKPFLVRNSDTNIIRLASKQEGSFFYSFRVFNKDNRPSSTSRRKKLTFPISPFLNWDKNE